MKLNTMSNLYVTPQTGCRCSSLLFAKPLGACLSRLSPAADDAEARARYRPALLFTNRLMLLLTRMQ